jgi:hypothetical protein
MIRHIVITENSSPEAWGELCSPELAEAAAKRLADMVAARIREEAPHAEVSTQVRDYTEGETTSLLAAPGATADDVTEYDRLQAIAGEAADDLWPDALWLAVARRQTG